MTSDRRHLDTRSADKRSAGQQHLTMQTRAYTYCSSKSKQISRQAIYRTPRRRTDPGPRPAPGGDRAIVAVAKDNPTDGTRMVAALTSREIRRPVSRKRAQR